MDGGVALDRKPDAGGVLARGGAELFAGALDLPIDGVGACAPGPGDFLGPHMLRDHTQTLAFALRQPVKSTRWTILRRHGHPHPKIQC